MESAKVVNKGAMTRQSGLNDIADDFFILISKEKKIVPSISENGSMFFLPLFPSREKRESIFKNITGLMSPLSLLFFSADPL